MSTESIKDVKDSNRTVSHQRTARKNMNNFSLGFALEYRIKK